jgi:pyruvate kinase
MTNITQNRHTKIVFTAGPACQDEDTLRQIILQGGDVCRINMAHVGPDWVKPFVQRLNKVGSALGKHIPIMMDIKGPEVRTGDLDSVWELQKDEIIHIVTDKSLLENRPSGIRAVTVNYPGIIHDIEIGKLILIDSGLIHLEVVGLEAQAIHCRVVIPGLLKSRRHVNLPGVKVRLPALTEKDKNDVLAGIDCGIHYYALSFVREACDIEALRAFLTQNGSPAKILAKIEDQSGVKNLEAIIKESDGVMVARGDLGVEWPFEELPMLQSRIVRACISQSKPVIVATHMLESMIQAPVPTRAEVSDIAQAIFQWADAIMLSGETSVGQYPVTCVEVMHKIACSTERFAELSRLPEVKLSTPRSKLMRSAMILAQELGGAPIVVFSSKGILPTILSSLRPSHCPAFVFTNDTRVYSEMQLLWGIEPFLIDFPQDPEIRWSNACAVLKANHRVAPQQWMVVVTYTLAEGKRYDSIQLRQMVE